MTPDSVSCPRNRLTDDTSYTTPADHEANHYRQNNPTGDLVAQ